MVETDQDLWRIDEGGFPGCPVGTVVTLVNEGDMARVMRPGIGQVGTLDASTTTQVRSSDGQSITLTNPSEGWRAVLTRTTPAAIAAVAAAGPATIVRTYKGKQQADATQAFQQDAAALAVQGYSPTSQSWAPGQWGCGAFIVALLLFLILIGIFVIFYMLVVKPAGTLTVTYTRQAPSASPQQPSMPAQSPAAAVGVADRLSQLDQAKSAGLISDEEYAARRAKILDDA